MSSEREQRYFKALGMRFEGQPGAIEAMLREQVQRVMAVADAEQAELRAEVERLDLIVDVNHAKWNWAEAQVARVEALMNRWRQEGIERGPDDMVYTAGVASMIRAALSDPEERS